MERNDKTVARGDSTRLGMWAVALTSLLVACASDQPRPAGGTQPVVVDLDASAPLDAGSGAAPRSVCVDDDGDGFGVGCARGADCDDADPSMTDGCYRCALPATDCACDDGAAPIGCDLESDTSRSLTGACHPGQRTCVGGRWSRCEPYRGAQRYVGAVSACGGSCLAGCHHQVICPEAGEPFDAECEDVEHGSFAPSVFCPPSTAPGGVQATCDGTGAGYVRTAVNFPFIDACGAPGALRLLTGANNAVATDTIPFPFEFYGDVRTSLQIGSNGTIGFPSTSGAGVSEPLALTSRRFAVMPFWDDLVATGGVCVATYGIAPNRQYVVEWLNARFNATGDTSRLTFEAIFSEGSNTIDFAYHTTDSSTAAARVTGSQAAIGLIGADNSQTDQYAYRLAGSVAAGRRLRWTPSGPGGRCVTGRFVQTVVATCENPNEIPVWDMMNLSGSVAPGGAVLLSVKTADSPAELSAAPAVLLPQLDAVGGNVPTHIPLTGQLRAADPRLALDRRPVMQLTAMLHPSADRRQPSVLGALEFQYICVPNEQLTSCTSGQPCSVGGSTCRRGVTNCENSAGGRPYEVCVEAGREDPGTSCGNGRVCNNDGDCVACSEGAACTIPGEACTQGRVSCSTGEPRCIAVGQLPPGTVCGGNIATYQRSNSTFDWIDACNAPGRELWLIGGSNRTQEVTLPFDLTLFGSARRDLTISQNGVLGFPTASPSDLNAALPNTVLGDAILPFWDSLLTPTGVCTAVVGAEPHRRFVVQYNNAQINGVAGSALNFEVVLSESTNAVDVIYHSMTGTGDRPSGSSATIGIQRADGAFFDQVSHNTAGAVGTGTTIRWTTNVTGVCDPRGVCVPCSPGVACNANGICALGTQTCTAGIAMCIPTGRRAATPEACNGVDDDCDGIVDEDCRPCVQAVGGTTTRATQTVWEINRGTGPICWGFQTARHGDAIEYSYTSIPPTTDPGWAPHGNNIYFADPSTLCGVCNCRYGGDFTHFQTSFVLPPGYNASSLRIQVGSVDDGVRMTVFNNRYPNGIVDPGSYAYFPAGGSTDLAAYLAPGPNRIVLTHVDDCCRERIIRGVSIVLNDEPLVACTDITNPTQCLPGWADCDGNAMNGCEENLANSTFACGACGVSCGSGWCDNGTCRASSCNNNVRDGNESDVDCGGSCGPCNSCLACARNSDCASGMCLDGQCGFVAERYLDWRSQCSGIGGTEQLVVRDMPAGEYRIEALPSAGANGAVNPPSSGWSWRLDGDCAGLSVPALGQTPSFATREAAYSALPQTTTSANWAGGTMTCRFQDADCRDNQGGVYFRLTMACAPLPDRCAPGTADCDRNPTNGCEVNIASSLGACGACGRACPSAANAVATCTAGACGFTCAAGWADCDGDASNGCEANLASDTGSCGTCGNVCQSGSRGAAQCVSGACRLLCETGYSDCDGDASNGCEARSSNDPTNCGGCGITCSAPNAQSTCTNGACTLGACVGSFRNCDGNLVNGCERDTGSDVNNCGLCGNRCPARSNAATTCTAGGCGFTCNPGWADCDGNPTNGCEVNLNTSTSNCGACGNVCSNPHGGAVCTAGTCGISTCSSGYSNCDGEVGNGCETNTRNNVNHCGGCGRVCSLPNATPRCGSSVCKISTCNANFGNCNNNNNDGCEASLLNDNNNCGACGARCGSGRACANGTCVRTGTPRFTLTWDRVGDMDLRVTPPCGTEVSYQRTSACNGTLDADATNSTGPENIFFTSSAARGTYSVCVSPHSISGPTNWTLRIYNGNTLVRTETGTSTSSLGNGCSQTISFNY
ncbi:MAG: hypothetical protein R3A48_15865 [Polyangiales bacterium]